MSNNEKAPNSVSIVLWKCFAIVVFALQAFASAILFLKALLLGIFPEKYLCLIGITLWLLLMVSCLMLFVGTKRPFSVSRMFRRLFAVLLAGLICYVSLTGYKAMDSVKTAIREVTSTKTVTDETTICTMNLYVFDEDTAKTAADCRSYLTGIVSGAKGRYAKAALNKMSAETGTAVRSKEYDSEGDLLDALYNEEVQAVLIDSNQLDILSETEEYKDMIEGMRLIREYDVSGSDLAFIPSKEGESESEESLIADNNAVEEGITTTPFIVYISGSDTRNKQFKTSRSDVNILMVVNPKSKQILLLNTPRDYYIPNPKSETGERDKLTHLGLYGVDCSMKGLADLYDCKVDYSAQINFTGLETLVDQLGGITIDNPQAFSSVGYKFKKGTITLNGKEALVYARERHSFATGDNMRGQNQMRIVTAMIKKLTASKSKLLKNYSGIMKALSGMFKTSMPTSDIEKLVKMQLNDMAEWKITSYAVTGTNGSETTYSAPKLKSYVMKPDQKSVNTAKTKIKRLMAGESL